MKNHPFIHRLKEILDPRSRYMRDLLWLFEKDLNAAHDNNDIFTQSKILAEMLFFSAEELNTDTKSKQDSLIFETLKKHYDQTVNLIETKYERIATPLDNATIAAHQYFQEKLADYQKHKIFFTKKKISFSIQLMDILARRKNNQEGYKLAKLTPDTSGPPAFNPARTFETHIDSLIGLHLHECTIQGVQPGKFGLLLDYVQNDKLTEAQMPSVKSLINEHNADAIQAYFNHEKQKTQQYSYFKRHWLNQLSQTHKKPAEYYQAWTNSNPYHHARSLALTESLKWGLGMIVLAVAVNLILAATTGGVGNLVAITAAYAAMSSTPGGYAVLAGGTGIVSGVLSYKYHKAQYAFKQQAITDCIASEPTKQTLGNTMG